MREEHEGIYDLTIEVEYGSGAYAHRYEVPWQIIITNLRPEEETTKSITAVDSSQDE